MTQLQIASLETIIDELRRRCSNLKSGMIERKKEIDRLETEVNELTEVRGALRIQNKESTAHVTVLQQQNSDLRARNRRQSDTITGLQKKLAAQPVPGNYDALQERCDSAERENLTLTTELNQERSVRTQWQERARLAQSCLDTLQVKASYLEAVNKYTRGIVDKVQCKTEPSYGRFEEEGVLYNFRGKTWIVVGYMPEPTVLFRAVEDGKLGERWALIPDSPLADEFKAVE